MVLRGAVVLIVGSTEGLDFILLQLISSYCRVYVIGTPQESPAFRRAKTRMHDFELVYLGGSIEEGVEAKSFDIAQQMEEFTRRESRLDLLIFSSADDEERSIQYILPMLTATAKHHECANVIIMKHTAARPRTRKDSLRARVAMRMPGRGSHSSISSTSSDEDYCGGIDSHATGTRRVAVACQGEDDDDDDDDDDDEDDSEDEEEEDEEDDDVRAERVRDALRRVCEVESGEDACANIFFNATSPASLLSVILQFDQFRQTYREHHRDDDDHAIKLQQ
ncbi:uncharacterized protein V1518DRAFT_413730 [Limtongia smithiae]|uniref:uncharacterized protein n=1 Tax=Limtongia smithiae TaxID=1125753 RepID=UPI0034CEACBF